MIEDKDLGLKITDSREEKIWTTTKESTEHRIQQLEDSLVIEKALLDLANKKLDEMGVKKDAEEGLLE